MAVTIPEHGRTFRRCCYPSTEERNPAFDAAAFDKSWHRYVGSVHRHWQTQELVLCWCTDGPHPQERETLRARLEAHPGNIGSLLANYDAKKARWNREVEAANRLVLAGLATTEG